MSKTPSGVSPEKRKRRPSIAIAAARDGRVVWSDAYGVVDKTRRTPATPTTSYAVASLTKTCTATALTGAQRNVRPAWPSTILDGGASSQNAAHRVVVWPQVGGGWALDRA